MMIQLELNVTIYRLGSVSLFCRLIQKKLYQVSFRFIEFLIFKGAEDGKRMGEM